MKKNHHPRQYTYKGQELEVTFERGFWTENGKQDWSRHVEIVKVELLGSELSWGSLPTGLLGDLMGLASDDMGEWV